MEVLGKCKCFNDMEISGVCLSLHLFPYKYTYTDIYIWVLESGRTDLGIPEETGVFARKVLSARKVLPARKA